MILAFLLDVLLSLTAPSVGQLRNTCAPDSLVPLRGPLVVVLYQWKQAPVWISNGALVLVVPALFARMRAEASPVQIASVGGIAPGQRVTFAAPDTGSVPLTYGATARTSPAQESCLLPPFATVAPVPR